MGDVSENMIINKTMDRDDLNSAEAALILRELDQLVRELHAKELMISNWYGSLGLSRSIRKRESANRGYGYQGIPGAADDSCFPWFLYWEIAWVVMNTDFKPGDAVLDLGGSSSLFSCYLATKGCSVTTVDINPELVENANNIARAMKWPLKNFEMDIRDIDMDTKFDHVTSICVYEHIPIQDRISINTRIKDLLVEGGTVSLTFDYRNPSKKARISSPHDVWEQFVDPSELNVVGNAEFYDNGMNYLIHPAYYKNLRTSLFWKIRYTLLGHVDLHDFFKTSNGNQYTFGALFLKK